MTKLRPPDGRIFVSLNQRHKKQFDVTVQAIGRNSEFVVGQKLCVVGSLQRVEIQDDEVYVVNEANVVMIYE
jgi:DNA-binding transcriptional regulator/RsmH inhibitor MraZ